MRSGVTSSTGWPSWVGRNPALWCPEREVGKAPPLAPQLNHATAPKSGVVTVKEIELWVEHMRPAYGAPLEWMKTALLDWFAAMREANLWEDDSDIPVEAFVRGGGGAPQITRSEAHGRSLD